MSEKKEKITDQDLVKMEVAARLQFRTDFEDDFLDNLKRRFLRYGRKMVITKDQQRILDELCERVTDAERFLRYQEPI